MIRDLSKRVALLVVIGLLVAACSSGSGSGADSTTTSMLSTSTELTTTTAAPTTTTIFYAYPAAAVAEFVQGCTAVGAAPSQCQCVVTGAQQIMAYEDFAELVNPELTAYEPTPELEDLVAACRA
ncbi:MAG: hypothetical protein ACC652_03135 [Acidimicrobiales bacterium]